MGPYNRAITVVAFVVALLSASALSVQAAGPAKVDGNPTCELLASEFNFDFLLEYKLDPVVDVEVPFVFDGDSGALDIDVIDPQTFDFDFSGNFAAVAVFAKAGNGGNLYLYDDGQSGDGGLQGPGAPNAETFLDLSHITFCIVATQAQNEPLPENPESPPAGEVSTNPNGSPSEPEIPPAGTDVPQTEEETPDAPDEPQSTDKAPSDPEEPQPADETLPERDAPQTSNDTPSETEEPPSAGAAPSSQDGSPSGSEASTSDEDASSGLDSLQEVAGPIFLPVIHG